ncbi:tautomerase family protein [Denitromonas iodatirespirans]|uniref:Tautomerase family protein n=1 Tax=Denitromonas iodatirespirans TaxID=2795389 RepID=A0A944DCT1_DENI1|nr:tautomerase family protein [Denitromonas iodatirespirans]MBT0963860.1 tautomerase family protein [Denitromonas iodatirespirans]
MPLVRINLSEATSPQVAQILSDVVHQALVDTFNVPPDDRFQIIDRHAAGDIVCAEEYLGIRHSARVVFVQIVCAPGRTVDMKQALYARIAAQVEARTDISARDVIIHLVESARENWSFGNGVAQYVPASASR